MTRALPRTHFHSSTLIRCLADLAVADVAEPGNAFAEKLGMWVHFTDAITLHAVHGEGVALSSSASSAASASSAPAGARADASAEFARVQASLANAIAGSFSPGAGKTHHALPLPPTGLPLNPATAYVPYRRFYEAHQRDMELRIPPLRVNVRAALARQSPALRKLAELDATFDKILRERESKLLATIPVLLKKRFEQLYKDHQQRLAETGQADDPAGWMQAGAWLARFCRDLQMLLQAELELRLQPAQGLIEACKHDTK